MFSKNAKGALRLNFSTCARLYKDSYLHNPGSEPLSSETIGDVVLRSANIFPGRPAVSSVYENVSLTYEELLTQADRLGCALRAQGLEKGDRVGIWSHNSVSWVLTFVAAARTGLIPVAINPLYEKSELSFCIRKTGMKTLLVGEQLPNRHYYDILRNLLPELPDSKPGGFKSDAFPTLTSIISSGKDKLPGISSIDSLIADYNGDEASKYNAEVKPADGSIIHFTSGTTGDPKAALDSHYGVVNNTYFTGKRNKFHEGHQKVCHMVPMFHALGSVITTMGALRHGATVVIPSPTYNVAANLNALVSEQCTAVTGTPTMYVDMLTSIRSMSDYPAKLEMVLAAGAPCSPQLIREIQKHMKAERVSVIDDDGNVVPFGSPGELISRGYNNMICYWDEPEKTKNTIKDGWLYTGDKFKILEDGYGRIVGRLKDIIVRGGENIAPKEIEDLLNTHPDIIESQVVGVSDERLGEELCAVLRIKDGATVTSKDVANHCSGKLARYKIPRLLKFAKEFPKTASGKIQKYKLAEMVESGKL